MSSNPNFTESQQQAINHYGSHCVVAAVAGAGKTTTLTHRVRNLVDNHQIDSDRILLITFTKAAAKSMKERLNEVVPGHKAHVATFHSFCFKWLREFDPRWKQAGVILDPEREKWKADKWAAETVKKLRLGHSIKPTDVRRIVDSAKSRGVHPERLEETAAGVLDPQDMAIFRTYSAFARAENRFELADIQVYFWDLIESNEGVRSFITACYDEIMVDEYQDTDICQDRILQLIVTGDVKLMVVGDDDQSVYSFRHTTPQLIIDFHETWGGTAIHMEENFRSQAQILECANALIQHNEVRIPKTLRPVVGDQGHVEVVTDQPMVLAVLERIRALREEGFNWGDIAILYRTNAESGIFESVFTDNDIPYICASQREGFFGIPEVKTLISYLRMFEDNENTFALKFIWNRPKRFLRNDILKDAQDAAIDTDIQSVLGAAINRNPRSAAQLRDVQSIVEQGTDMVADGSSASDILDWLIGRLQYPKWLRELAETTNRPIEDLEQITERVLEDSAGRGGLDKYLRHVDKVIENSKKQEAGDAVLLTTLHKSKGLEWPVVFFSDLVKDMVPHPRCPDVNEERRLAYVGVTRAMYKLYICTSAREPSPFVAEMGLTIPEPVMNEGEPIADQETYSQGEETDELRYERDDGY